MNTATRTIEYSIGETEPLVGSQSMPTSTTCLAGIGWVHGDVLASGAFCLDSNHTPKTQPRRVRDRLGQTVIVKHPVDFQILDRNQPEAVDYPTGVLVREIVSTPVDALMHAGNYLTPLDTSGRALLLLGHKALRLSKGLFLRAEEARVGYFLSCGEGSKGFQANVYAHLFSRVGQGGRFPLTRERDIPLTRTTSLDAHRLWSALEGAVQRYLYRTDFRQVEDITYKGGPITVLRVAH